MTLRFIFCLALLSLSACPDLGSRYAARELWLEEPSSWEELQPLIERRCVACHGERPAAGATFSLVSYEDVYRWAERIRRRVLIEEDMPPGGLQDPDEREVLARWLAQGAPGPQEPKGGAQVGGGGALAGGSPGGEGVGGEDMGGEEGGRAEGGGSPQPLGWSDVAPLFDIYCNTCHADPPTGGAPFPLTSYQATRAYLERIQIRTIELRDMPPGGIQDPAHLERLELWLSQGGAE